MTDDRFQKLYDAARHAFRNLDQSFEWRRKQVRQALDLVCVEGDEAQIARFERGYALGFPPLWRLTQ
jgi:hypothetical protein